MFGFGLKALAGGCAMLALIAAAPAAAPDAATPDAATPAAPALWVVRDADSTMYLFGSQHDVPAGVSWGSRRVDEAYAEAEEIWLETLPIEDRGALDAKLLETGFDDQGRLEALLGPEDFQRLVQALQPHGYDAEILRHLKPWFAIMRVVNDGVIEPSPGAEAPAARVAGVDEEIAAAALEDGKPLRGLETAEAHFAGWAGVPEAEQVEMLREVLNVRFHPDEAEIDRAWREGDTDTLERLVVTLVRERWPGQFEFHRRRNQAWTEVLAREMQGSGVDLVVVGVAHLIGEGSVVAMLQARGFTVARIQ